MDLASPASRPQSLESFPALSPFWNAVLELSLEVLGQFSLGQILSLQTNWGLKRSLRGMNSSPGPQERELTLVWIFCRVPLWASWGRWAVGRAHCWPLSLGSFTGKQPLASPSSALPFSGHLPSSCYVVDTFFRGQRCQDEEDMVPFLGEFSVWKGGDSQESELS